MESSLSYLKIALIRSIVGLTACKVESIRKQHSDIVFTVLRLQHVRLLCVTTGLNMIDCILYGERVDCM